VCAVPLQYVAGLLNFGGLCVLAFALGVSRLYLEIGNQSYAPMIVQPERLVGTASRINSGTSLAETAGPGLSGLLIQTVQPPFAMLFDGLSFFVSAFFTAATKNLRTVAPIERPRRWVRAGFRILFGDPQLMTLAVTSACFNVCLRIAVVAFTIYAVREIGLSPLALGIALAIGGVGAMAGAALAGSIARLIGTMQSISKGILLASVGMFLVPWGFGPTAGFVVACVGLFLQWFGLGVYNVHVIVYRQKAAPSEVLGVVNACYKLISHGSIPIGALVGGVGSSAAGPRTTLISAGLCALVGALVAGVRLAKPRSTCVQQPGRHEREERSRRNRATSSRQPVGESPACGDARVPGSEAPDSG
jgi:predicted MFS family arabinose efflux permease